MIDNEKMLKRERMPGSETEQKEQGNKIEDPEKVIEEVEKLSAEVVKRGGEIREKIEERKPDQKIIKEFDEEENRIENAAKNAADLIIKNNTMEQFKGFHSDFSRENTIDKISEINEQIDNAHNNGLNIQKIEELKSQRKELLRLVDQNFDSPIGNKIGEKEAKQCQNSVDSAPGDFASKDLDNIKKELANKESPLSETMKKIKMKEFEISSIKDYLKELNRREASEQRDNVIEKNKRDLALKGIELAEMKIKVGDMLKKTDTNINDAKNKNDGSEYTWR